MEVSDFFDFLFRLGFSQSKWKRELPMVRGEMTDLKAKLIPFDKEELLLLSMNQRDTSSKRGFTKLYKGILETIYFESLYAYVIKQFSRDYRLTIVSSSKDEFIFLRKGQNQQQVYLNEVLIGNLDNNCVLTGDRRQTIGRIELTETTEMCPLWINSKNAGFAANPYIKKTTTTRAVQLFKELNEDEYNILTCLLLGMITNVIATRK